MKNICVKQIHTTINNAAEVNEEKKRISTYKFDWIDVVNTNKQTNKNKIKFRNNNCNREK